MVSVVDGHLESCGSVGSVVEVHITFAISSWQSVQCGEVVDVMSFFVECFFFFLDSVDDGLDVAVVSEKFDVLVVLIRVVIKRVISF